MTPKEWYDCHIKRSKEAFESGDIRRGIEWLKICKVKLSTHKLDKITVSQLPWIQEKLAYINKRLRHLTYDENMVDEKYRQDTEEKFRLVHILNREYLKLYFKYLRIS